MAVSVGRIEAILELKNRMSQKLKTATKDVNKFQSSMTSMGEKATRAGGAMTMAFTAPLAIIGVMAVKTFASFEKQMDAVLAVTQASETEFAQLGELAKRMGETTVFTAVQAAEAMRAFGLAGFSTNEIMNALEPTLNLAAAGAMDMGTAADIAAKVTRGYGIEAKDTTHAMDVLTKAFTSANTNLVELGSAFKMVGPIAKTVGMSFEETTAALQIMANAGHVSSRAGRMLRRSLLRLVNPSGKAEKALQRLGVQTTNAEGRLRPFDELVSELSPHLSKTADMAQIFGTIAMPGMVEILGAGADKLREMTVELEIAGGTGKRIADVMLDNVAGAFILLKSAIEGVWLSIGNSLEPVLRSMLKVFTAVAQFVSREIVPAFASLAPGFQVAVLAVGVFVAALGPLLMMFGLMAPAIPMFVSVGAAIAGAFSFPVVAIGALIGLFVVWLSRIEGVRKFVVALAKVLFQFSKVIIKGLIVAFDLVTKGLFAWWDLLRITINWMTGGLIGKAFGLLTRGLEATAEWMGEFTDSAKTVVPHIENVVAPVQDLTGVLDGMSDTVDDLIPGVDDLEESWKSIAQNLKSGAIPAAQDWMRAVQAVGGISQLTVQEQQSLHKALDDGIMKYRAMGQVGPHEMLKLWEATRLVGKETVNLGNIVEGVMITLPTFEEMFPWLDPKNQPEQIELKFATKMIGAKAPGPEMVSRGAVFGSMFRKGFGRVIADLPTTVADAFKGGGGLFGAFQAIGSQVGAAFGASIGTSLASGIGENAGKFAKAFGSMAGPLGAAIGSLVGPAIKGLKRLFGGRSVAKNIEITVQRKWGHALSKGLQEAIAKTSKTMRSTYAATLAHLGAIFEEAGGVMAFGLSKAISATRDLFVMVETGQMTVAQAGKGFDSAFSKISESAVSTGKIVGREFAELIDLAKQFGVASVSMLEFVREQSEVTATGISTIAASGIKSKAELEDLGLIAVASFESALDAGLSFTEAMRAHGPAINAVIEAQKALGVTSDNVAIQELTNFHQRISSHTNLVSAVEALDDVMLALSRTGSLNAETLSAMERQGLRMYDKLIEAGFTQQQTILQLGPSLTTILEAHRKLGIPIEENTKLLIEQAREAGALEGKQLTGWAAVAHAVGKVVDKLQEMIDRISGVDSGLRHLPRDVRTNVYVREHYMRASRPDYADDEGFVGFRHGGIVTSPTVGVIGEAGPEAVIPLSQLGDQGLLDEVRGMRSDFRRLPIMIRDALILAS
jgi:TP901 family phage tail tape measure protein